MRPSPALPLLALVLLLAGCGTDLTAPEAIPTVTAVDAAPPSSAAPATPEPGPSGPRPANGAVLVRQGPTGKGELTVVDDTPTDAYVMLSRGGHITRAVYVRAGNTATMHGVADGSYDMFATQGSGWNGDLRRFTAAPEYTKFDEPAAFTTNHATFTEFQISLKPQETGTATTSGVDEADLPT